MVGADKLAVDVAGRPLLAWTLAAVAAAPEVERIVVVAAAERVATLRRAPWLPSQVAAVVAGGERRQDSVAAGLAALLALEPGTGGDRRPVLVHDGARPLVSAALVAAVVRATAEHGAAIPGLPVTETLKRVAGGLVAATVPRAGLVSAQTPQGAQLGLLRRAHAERPPDPGPELTDDAALLEASGVPVHVIPGDPMNLKVTVPADLRRVEAALGGGGPGRIGWGIDRHPFGPGAPLRLGGLEVPGAPRLHGHSDGDVVLHAIADALLGGAGLGDLGRIFPADERTPAGADSRYLLAEVVRRVVAAGWQPSAVDVTIEGARPRLGAYLEPMRRVIAGLLGVSPEVVSVKASSANLEGAEGAGRAIAASVVATLAGRDAA
jgi:2-C-methyl-D-erythritol 4-phosphate cytidylyltransferase/2-C-methyl-D-erythritol 2,4-cyclodiphosphate synthase